ncbi:aromatic ring-hydroxylating dioxygenase subunit alpha [Pseudomonas kielensis]|uniref:aromatic ring-hydroxylating oxygenase subunit alpha n=1 Tax=Pseudomonas kielensis TaxID=2762577 RepID=UPI00223F6835|nr:aromatic ring-hydroxylating dioxygenase subunit alpha [Pseudomonas kielensis]UZM13980.1 aromatic ring-hydroxylating dioxygenase subunit alpha [Pseudomonas kielensis]
MRAQRKREIAEQLKVLLGSSTSSLAETFQFHPVDGYKNQAVFQAEQSVLFTQYPFIAGYEAELADIGSFVTRELVGVPVLLTKDERGEIRAFVNICRHRGNRLCRQAHGKQKTFVCQYHGWAYDNTGACLSVANAAAFQGLDRQNVGLKALCVQVRHGLVWVQLPGAEPCDLPAFLGSEIDQDLAEYLPRMQKVAHQREDRMPFNWKLGVETFLEIFHVATLHKETIAPHFYRGVMVHDRLERHSRIAAARPSLARTETEVGAADIGEHILLIYFLYPNTVYLLQRHHVEVYSFYPGTSAGNCVVRTALLRPDGKLADRAQTLWDKNWAFLCESVYDEDFSTAALVQHSIESGAIEHFVFGRNEDALQYFHANLKRSLNENVLT